MNSRTKKRLTRSWQDRDWNRNRRCWHRLPVPLGQSCWVLEVNEESIWQPVEKKLAGVVDLHAFGMGMTYAVQDVDDLSLTDLVLPHDLFEFFEQANQEAERRNRQK